MHAPTQTTSLGCMHRLPARLTASPKLAQQHSRCLHGKALQVRAVAEVETQTPIPTNGASHKVLSSCIYFLWFRLSAPVNDPGRYVQAGAPQGTPVVETLVRVASWSNPQSAQLRRTALMLLSCCTPELTLSSKTKQTESNSQACLFRDTHISSQPHTASVRA